MSVALNTGSTRRPLASGQPTTARQPLTARRGASFGFGVAGVALAFGVVELISVTGLVSRQDVPAPTRIASSFISMLGSGGLWQLVADTMGGWALGLGLAVAGGIVLGLLLGSNEYLWVAFRPTVEFLRPVPSVALVPLAILLWGQAIGSKVFLIIVGAIWPMVIQTMYGVSQVDDVARNTARSYNLSRWDRIRYLLIPSALPYIATGLRIASATALIVGVTAEVVIGNHGLGNAISLAQAGGDTVKMYALIFATGLLGVLVHIVFSGLERHFLRWHTSQRRSV